MVVSSGSDSDDTLVGASPKSPVITNGRSGGRSTINGPSSRHSTSKAVVVVEKINCHTVGGVGDDTSDAEEDDVQKEAGSRKRERTSNVEPYHIRKKARKLSTGSENSSKSEAEAVVHNSRSQRAAARKPKYMEINNASDSEDTDDIPLMNRKPTARPSRRPQHKENNRVIESESSDSEQVQVTRKRSPRSTAGQKLVYKENSTLSSDLESSQRTKKSVGRPSRKPMHKENKELSESRSSDSEPIRINNRKPTGRPSRLPRHKEVKKSDSDSEEASVEDTNVRTRKLDGQKPAFKESNSNDESGDGDSGESWTAKNSTSTRRMKPGISYKDVDSSSGNEEEMSGDDSSSTWGTDDSYGKKAKKSKKSGQKGKDIRAKPKTVGPRVSLVMNRRMGKVGATGPATTKYNVDKNGDPNVTLPDDTELEPQYWIKWKDESHLHNTWESVKTLEAMGGDYVKFNLTMRVSKYETVEDQFESWCRRADPDDVEYAKCEREMEKDLLTCYSRAERIISRAIGSTGKLEYYVKWEGLPYCESTWEAGDLIKKYFRPVIDVFDMLRRASTIPENSKFDNKRPRPKFVQMKVQPDYMKGNAKDLALRDYQLDSVNWLIHGWCKRNSVILGDEMGLGKTIQAICFLQYLFQTHGVFGPFLVVVPLSTISAWMKEFALWAPNMNVVTLIGDQASRDIIKQDEFYNSGWQRFFKFNVLLTSYEMVVKEFTILSKATWQVMIVDEAHRLKNQKSEWHKYLTAYKSNHTILMTGTPIQNSLEELWSLLHFIMPDTFPSWQSFEAEHASAAGDGYKKLHAQLEPFLIRRVKKDVEKSLPMKREKILRVPMTPEQREIYKHIISRNYPALSRPGSGSKQTFLNMEMQLRKCCNHAKLIRKDDGSVALSGTEDSIEQLLLGSGKLMLLDKLLVRLKTMGHRVLIFSQFVIMLDVIEELLQLRRFIFQRLDGSTGNNIRQQALKRFNDPDSKDFCFLLSTRAGGLGINLTAANTVIIFDSDYNPQNDLQAQARAHRIGQTRQVNVYKIITKNSVEEKIIETAKQKMVLDHLVIQRMDTTGLRAVNPSKKPSMLDAEFTKDELNAILKFGAEEIFKDNTKSSDYVCDIDEILKQADEEEPLPDNEKPSDELLSAFKVISFANDQKDWDEIIPEHIRGQWENEERDRKLTEALTLDRRARHEKMKLLRKTKSPKKTKRQKAMGASKKTHGNQEEIQSESSSLGETEPGPSRGRGSQHDRDFALSETSDFGDSDEIDEDYFMGDKLNVKKVPKLYGLTLQEVKNFIRSFPKFPKPMSRLPDIALVAGLAEKDMDSLQKLGKLLLTAVSSTMAAAERYRERVAREQEAYVQQNQALLDRLEALQTQTAVVKNGSAPVANSLPEVVTLDDDSNDTVKVSTSPETIPAAATPATTTPTSLIPGNGSIPESTLAKLAELQRQIPPPPTYLNPYNFNFDAFPAYKINARNLSMELQLLEPLGCIVPVDKEARKVWKFDCPVIGPKYDVPWGQDDDTQLLLGVWEHGNIGFMSLMPTVPVLKQKVQMVGLGKKPTLNDIHRRFTCLLTAIRKFMKIAATRGISLQAAIAESKPRPAPVVPAPSQSILLPISRPITAKPAAPLVPTPFMVIVPPTELTQQFTSWEVRRIVAALEEFPNPFSRMRDVARHAVISKPLSVLARLGQFILEKCREQAHKNKMLDSKPAIDPNIKPVKPNLLYISEAPIHFSMFLSRLEKLMALDELIPSTEARRKSWVFPYILKTPPTYSAPWGQEEDTRLLLAVWEHGITNIEAMTRSDEVLSKKILRATNGWQPTFKTIPTRIRHLLDLILKQKTNDIKPLKKSPPPTSNAMKNMPSTSKAAIAKVATKTLLSTSKAKPSHNKIGSKENPGRKNNNELMQGFVNPSRASGIKKKMSIAEYLKFFPELTQVRVKLPRLDAKTIKPIKTEKAVKRSPPKMNTPSPQKKELHNVSISA